jgi:hypothetical protein
MKRDWHQVYVGKAGCLRSIQDLGQVSAEGRKRLSYDESVTSSGILAESAIAAVKKLDACCRDIKAPFVHRFPQSCCELISVHLGLILKKASALLFSIFTLKLNLFWRCLRVRLKRNSQLVAAIGKLQRSIGKLGKGQLWAACIHQASPNARIGVPYCCRAAWNSNLPDAKP